MVNQGDVLKIDDSGSRPTSAPTPPPAIPTPAGSPAFPITLTNGKPIVGGGCFDPAGYNHATGQTADDIESDSNGSGTSLLQIAGLTVNAGVDLNFIGGGTPLANAPTKNCCSCRTTLVAYPVPTNGIMLQSTVSGPGSLDFATLTGGPNGVAIIPLPAADEFSSFAAIPVGTTTANVKIAPTSLKRTSPTRSTRRSLAPPPCCIFAVITLTTLTVSSVFGFLQRIVCRRS